MYLTGYSAFDDWRITRRIGRTWSMIVSNNSFFIIAILPGVGYLIVNQKLKNSKRKLLIKEFDDIG